MNEQIIQATYSWEDLLRIYGGDLRKYGRRTSYRILIDYTEKLLNDIYHNRLIDDQVYLAIIPIKGSELKAARDRPGALSYTITCLEYHLREWRQEVHSFPNRHNIQVYEHPGNPTFYRIHPSFPAAQALARELQMPSDANQIYGLLVRTGNTIHTRYKKYEGYSVEEFGLTIKRPSMPKPDSDDDEPWKYSRPDTPKPDPSLYQSAPRYWRFGDYLIQIWRTRVLASPQDFFTCSLEQPFMVTHPTVMYFQEIWHPNRGTKRLIGGLEYLEQSADCRDSGAFERDARRILGYRVRNVGKYESAEQLRDALDQARSRIAEYQTKPGGQAIYAIELNIDRKTLRKYLRKFGLSLPR